MNESSGKNAGRHHNPFQRKARDRSLALLIAGIVFLMPPAAGIFRIDGTLVGIPVTLVYVFFVWLVLVAGAARLRPSLQSLDELERSATAARKQD